MSNFQNKRRRRRLRRRRQSRSILFSIYYFDVSIYLLSIIMVWLVLVQCFFSPSLYLLSHFCSDYIKRLIQKKTRDMYRKICTFQILWLFYGRNIFFRQNFHLYSNGEGGRERLCSNNIGADIILLVVCIR